MEKTYGYYIHMIIGHSRGSLVGCKWLASGTPQAASVEVFVNISGRYRMEVSKRNDIPPEPSHLPQKFHSDYSHSDLETTATDTVSLD